MTRVAVAILTLSGSEWAIAAHAKSINAILANHNKPLQEKISGMFWTIIGRSSDISKTNQNGTFNSLQQNNNPLQKIDNISQPQTNNSPKTTNPPKSSLQDRMQNEQKYLQTNAPSPSEVPQLGHGENITKEELVSTIEKFKKIAPKANAGSGTAVYELNLKPTVFIGHRGDGLFYIQDETTFQSSGKLGSASISTNSRGELYIGHSPNVTQEQLNAAYSVLAAITRGDEQEIKDEFLLLRHANLPPYDEINSSTLLESLHGWTTNSGTLAREAHDKFCEKNPNKRSLPGMHLQAKIFPNNMVRLDNGELIPFNEFTMTYKQELAINVKGVDNDKPYHKSNFTNGEGACHSFFSTLVSGFMYIDGLWAGKKVISALDENKPMLRPCILSTTIQPDLEYDNVMLPIFELEKKKIKGEKLNPNYVFISPQEKRDKKKLEAHELLLKKHMISNLFSNSTKPAKGSIKQNNIHKVSGNVSAASIELSFLNDLILNKKDPSQLIDQAVVVTGNKREKTLSLEAMFNFYKAQLTSELLALENLCPQGYTFTIDPPAFFVQSIGKGGACVLNRLQALAMQQLIKEGKIRNMRTVAFNDYEDKDMIRLYQSITKDTKIKVLRKVKSDTDDGVAGLFQNNGKCLLSPEDPSALVLHNNSDGFGLNIRNESPGSLDGMIGSYSSFGDSFDPTRKDLLHHTFTQEELERLKVLLEKKRRLATLKN